MWVTDSDWFCMGFRSEQMNKLRGMFNPTPEEKAEDDARMMRIFEQAAKDKGCSTCANKKHVVDYPGFVTGEENECTVGLECDTVLFRVKNCPKWERMELNV